MGDFERMNRYTFRWNLSPSLSVEYSISVPPFEVVAYDHALALSTSGNSADETNLLQQADRVAHDLIRGFSYELGKRFEITDCTQQSSDGSVTVFPAGVDAVSACGTAGFEQQDSAGNVVDSSAMQREREREAGQKRLSDLTKRVARDADLRDMLDYWSRYVADTDGRLHPLYDVLQAAERYFARSKKPPEERRRKARETAANELGIDLGELNLLGDVTNDPELVNGRHPGLSQGRHRVASAVEVANCERIARAIIDKMSRR